jgi:glycosyltransferase involved in cell wall biosynthesis
MIIGIDARFALGKRRGVGKYSLNLIRYLSEADKGNKYVLYIDREDVEGILPKRENFQIKNIGSWNYLIWEQILLPLEARKDKIDILHCTSNTSPVFLPRGLALVSTVHDVSYLKPYSVMPKSPYLYQKLGRVYRKAVVPKSLKKSDMVITVSEFAKKDILSHIHFLNEAKVFITYEAVSDVFKVIDKEDAKRFAKLRYGIAGNYILNVGGRDPQKNTAFLIENFIELKKTRRSLGKMVIVGFLNYNKTDFYKDLVNSGLKNEVYFIDFVSENELVQLYNGAELFVFPSLYESFGLPPLEAMACGVPVIASNTGAIPEIVGDAAMLINPKSKDEYRAALLRLLGEQGLRQELIRRGFERIKKFSWLKMAVETLSVYARLRN